MKKAAILLMMITIVSKILGFLRDVVMTNFYGISIEASAYSVAVTIPGTIFALVGAGIATGYIPIYSKIEKQLGRKAANNFTSNIINFVMIISTVIVIVVLLFTDAITNIFAGGLSEDAFNLAVNLTRITILGIWFIGLTYIFTAYLNVRNRFLIPALVSVPMNICILISIFISSKTSIEVLAIGTVIAIVAQIIFLIPFMKKEYYTHQLILDRKDKYLNEMIKLAIPVIIGISVNQVNIIVDSRIASGIGDGSIAALSYASKLNGFIQGIFVVSIITVMYPVISKMALDNNIEGLKTTFKKAVIGVSTIVIPITVGAMIFSEPIIRLLFERGKFNSDATLITAEVWFFYVIGLIGYGLREIICKVFYSFNDTKTPMKNAAFAVGINIILSIVLSSSMGLKGLALATSLAGIICSIILSISLRKKIGAIGLKTILISLGKILISTMVMAFCVNRGFTAFTSIVGESISLIIWVIIGAVVYFMCILLMKIEEVDSIINIIKHRFLGRQK